MKLALVHDTYITRHITGFNAKETSFTLPQIFPPEPTVLKRSDINMRNEMCLGVL